MNRLAIWVQFYKKNNNNKHNNFSTIKEYNQEMQWGNRSSGKLNVFDRLYIIMIDKNKVNFIHYRQRQ